MRILLAHNSLFFPSHGGGDKSNRLLMEALAQAGHECLVVARIASFGEGEEEHFLDELGARGVPVESTKGGIVVFRHGGVRVHTVTSHANLRAYFSSQIDEFQPDIILTSTDDPAQVMLEAALKAERARVVYMVRATIALPFGPDAAFPSAAKTESLRRVDGMVGVSQYTADYVRRHSGIQAVHVPISMQDKSPIPALGRFDNEFVVMVNPCVVKGVSIFLALADALPEVGFAGVPTWGTTEEDIAALNARANVTVLEPDDNIDNILRRARVLLLPSIWAEARARIPVEAMLRGVPALAADVGGIPEAMMGVPYLLSVNMIQRYKPEVNEQMVPVAEAPPQDIGPWLDALKRLTSDREHWEELSALGRRKALEYVDNLNVGALVEYLEGVRGAAIRARVAPAGSTGASTGTPSLSPEKRRLLAARAHRALWFPIVRGEAPRLFCLPFAGAGVWPFRQWAEQLPDVSLVPVLLPGREMRLHETPFDSMAALIAALEREIAPLLTRPFALYGHSMGAVIAFELARALRRSGRRMPAGVFVSGARAPQFRRNHVPPPAPTDDELMAELRRLESVPRDLLESPGFTEAALPALRADTALFRNYIYAEEAPLGIPICAYSGASDPNVTPEHIEAWREQTKSSFASTMLPGGHFFIDSARAEFLAKLGEDIAGVLKPVTSATSPENRP